MEGFRIELEFSVQKSIVVKKSSSDRLLLLLAKIKEFEHLEDVYLVYLFSSK